MHPNVQFVADAHSHMMDSAEVIGLLAGIFDKEHKVLYIQVSDECRTTIKVIEILYRPTTNQSLDFDTDFYSLISLST